MAEPRQPSPVLPRSVSPNREIVTPQTLAFTPETDPLWKPWQEFLRDFNWIQGEHITAIGPTGWGKSTLINRLLHKRTYCVAFGVKKKDETLDELEHKGFEVQRKFRPETSNRIILWPKLERDGNGSQKKIFGDALWRIYEMGGWCLDMDEAVYLSRDLKLEVDMNRLWMNGRAEGISVVAATQRPAYLPLYAYDQPTHYFFWKMRLSNDARRIGELGGVPLNEMMALIRKLPKYYCLYFNKETDEMYITKPEV
jgi:hypothetical protein